MRQNLSYKIIAVLLAIGLWFYVLLTEDNPITERKLTVPLHVGRVATGLVATGYPERVQVTLRGPKRVMAALGENAVRALLDLSAGKQGEQTLAVRALASDQVTVVGVQPPRVTLQVEREAAKSMRVECTVLGNPPAGTVLAPVEISPPAVRVSGPHTAVDMAAHAQVTLSADLSGVRDLAVPVRPVRQDGTVVPEVKVTPALVRVSLPTERRLEYKTVPVRVQVTGVPEGMRIKSVAVDPPTVTVSGESKQLARTGYLSLEVIDLAQAGAGERTYSLALQRPAGVLLLEEKRVQVRVTLEPAPAGALVEE
jgi:YbbR domain-containing protein